MEEQLPMLHKKSFNLQVRWEVPTLSNFYTDPLTQNLDIQLNSPYKYKNMEWKKVISISMTSMDIGKTISETPHSKISTTTFHLQNFMELPAG